MILPNNDCIQSITIVHKQALLDQLSRYMIMLKCKLAVTKCKEQAARKIEAAQQNQKRGFDKKRKAPRKYRPGDLVLIKKQHPATGASRKLQNPYSGPLVVKVALPNDRYIVTDMTGSYRAENRTNYERTVAVDRMKPWCTPGVVNMAPIKKKIDRQEQVKQNMRKMRAKIKSDPVKYEEYKRKERERYKKRKAEGKIQKISDLPERQQRAKHSPPPSPSSIEPDTLNLTPNRQLLQGQKRSRNHRRKLNKTIKSLQERNKLLEKKVKKYKSKVSRLKKKAIDPNSPDILDVNQIQWHYSESGHGKGAPDGIGGSVKRKADESVARGKVLDGKENEEYTISFMRRKTDTKFVFPIQEDIAKIKPII
ncbi:unnamed protein product [Callosobruchus maculatus]|uniref:Uncharacterized protein n=1 Tax=Callosobruchus maculatus TaxID=64391 RepID=A0A653BLQ7_CALMS|nr:unnamed protein product [Callosobruchus maculatus]